VHLRHRVENFDEWLDSPVLKSEVLAEERRQDRLKALMRGEIPA
jgi:hypothetical protein